MPRVSPDVANEIAPLVAAARDKVLNEQGLPNFRSRPLPNVDKAFSRVVYEVNSVCRHLSAINSYSNMFLNVTPDNLKRLKKLTLYHSVLRCWSYQIASNHG